MAHPLLAALTGTLMIASPFVGSAPADPPAAQAGVNSDAAISIAALVGSSITDESGQTVARIEDLAFDEEGKISALLCGRGGIAGIGVERIVIPYTAVTVDRLADNPAALIVKTNGETLPADDSEVWDHSSQVVGASASFNAGVDEAVVTDLLFSTDGRITHLVANNGVFSNVHDTQRAVTFDQVSIDRQNASVILHLSSDEFNALPVYRTE